MFVKCPKFPAAFVLKLHTTAASTKQSERNVHYTGQGDEKKLNKKPQGFCHEAFILPLSPAKVNDLIKNILALGTRYELKIKKKTLS